MPTDPLSVDPGMNPQARQMLEWLQSPEGIAWQKARQEFANTGQPIPPEVVRPPWLDDTGKPLPGFETVAFLTPEQLQQQSNGQGQMGPGYTQAENAFDPVNPSTWALLAPYAAQVTGGLDAERQYINRALPVSGARDLALANAQRGAFSDIAKGRQGLMDQGLGALTNMETSLRTGTGLPAYQGSAQALLNAATSKYGIDTNYNLGLQGLASAERTAESGKSGFWGGLGNVLGTIGAKVGGDWLSSKVVKSQG